MLRLFLFLAAGCAPFAAGADTSGAKLVATGTLFELKPEGLDSELRMLVVRTYYALQATAPQPFPVRDDTRVALVPLDPRQEDSAQNKDRVYVWLNETSVPISVDNDALPVDSGTVKLERVEDDRLGTISPNRTYTWLFAAELLASGGPWSAEEISRPKEKFDKSAALLADCLKTRASCGPDASGIDYLSQAAKDMVRSYRGGAGSDFRPDRVFFVGRCC